MKPPKSILYAAVAVCAAFAAACTTTAKLTDQQIIPNYDKKLTSGRVMVMATTTQPDIRRQFEDQLVARLKAAGVSAIPSYPYVATASQPDGESAARAVQNTGAGAVLVLRPTGSRQESVPLGDPWMGVGAPADTVVEALRKQQTYTVYTADARLIDAKENKIVWSGTLQTTSPGDRKVAADIAAEYADKVVEALLDKKLV